MNAINHFGFSLVPFRYVENGDVIQYRTLGSVTNADKNMLSVSV